MFSQHAWNEHITSSFSPVLTPSLRGIWNYIQSFRLEEGTETDLSFNQIYRSITDQSWSVMYNDQNIIYETLWFQKTRTCPSCML